MPINDLLDMPLAIDNSDPINPTSDCFGFVSKCTGNHSNNMFWREGAPGYPGQCILDQMDFEQLFLVLSRVPTAGEHLIRITNDPVLLRLARETKLGIPEYEDDQRAADMINKGKGTGAGTLPYYTVIGGNVDGSIIGKK